MAKQTFTTGQVLTAAQMTSLQQTAMGGGAATAKTANYVLVAADAGTTVAMNAAGATTITVNTGLFAAGDTVFIQNLGAGACTVTAGTATVATAGSLILPQNDAGILYFTSASAAIFYDYIQVGATSPLTTKGDLYTFGTSDDRLGVGSNGTILVADSAETTGLKWVTPTAAGTNWSLVNAGGTALTGAATVTVSGISGADKVMVILTSASSANASANISIRINGDTAGNYATYGIMTFNQTTFSAGVINKLSSDTASEILIGRMTTTATTSISGTCLITGGNASGVKVFQSAGNSAAAAGEGTGKAFILGGYWNNSATISSISAFSDDGNFDNGTIFVYKSA